jgi:hypothetical protein
MKPQQMQSSRRVRAQYFKALEQLSGQLLETWQGILPPDARFPRGTSEAFFEAFAQFGVALYDAYAQELLSTCPSPDDYANALNFDLKTRVCNQIYPYRETPIKTLQDALDADARGEVPDEWTVRMGETWRLFHHPQHSALDDRVHREFIDLYGHLPELWNRLIERVHTAISRRTIHWMATHADRVASGAANAEEKPRSAVLQTQSIFVSYAWTEESNAIVDHLQSELAKHGIRLLRDREEIRYRDSVRDFMRRLGQGKAVVAIISEKYLKSENCMFEMLEITRAGTLRERIFPIVLADANIYKATG